MKDYEKIEELENLMGTEALLKEIIISMSSEELEETIEWITRMHDIEI